MVDLLDYLRGDGRLYELVNTFGSYEIVQTQTEAGNVFYHVKNSQWEELWADTLFIYRGTDTSPGDGEVYTLTENNHYGSAWVPRYFDVGRVFRRYPTVTWRIKANGLPVPGKPPAGVPTYIKFVALHDSLIFTSGLRLNDVAELHGLLDGGGQPSTTIFEKYYYAKGFGLVAFEDTSGSGFKSWIAQKFTSTTMPQRVREKLPWLTPMQNRYFLPGLPVVTPSGQFALTQLPAKWVNVRSYPNVWGEDKGDLQPNDVVTLYSPDIDGWVYVQKDSLGGWVSLQNGAVAFSPSNTPAPEPPPIPPDGWPPLPKITPAGQFTLTQIPGTWINVRAYPDTQGADIGDLHKGDVVTLFGPEVNGWVFVESGDLRGWVSRQDGKVAFAPAGTTTPTPPPPTTPPAPSTPVPPDGLPPLPKVNPVGQFKVTQLPSTWVNVRTYPSEAGSDVGDLHQGDVMTLYAPEVNGWVYMQMGMTVGWVSRQNGKVVFAPVTATASSNGSSQSALPNSKEETIKLRDAYRQVEDSVRQLRQHLDHLIDKEG